ncbi:MAG TPA: extracellular solute-binding protein, partial [Bacilli bacterium]
MTNMKSSILRKMMTISLILCLMVPVLAACMKKNEEDPDKVRVLRIATNADYGMDTEYFRSQFTEIFEYANPNIEIELIPIYDERQQGGFYGKEGDGLAEGEEPFDPMKMLKELMDSATPPDIVVMQIDDLTELVAENRLTPLDTLMADDKINIEDFVPSVIEGLKKAGDGGKLYALAPMFTAQALIYNKAMFAEANVTPPTDRMTWDDIFNLARQVQSGEGEDKKYGFSFTNYSGNDLFYDMTSYMAALDLRMFDDAGEKMTVATPEWEKVWTTMIGISKEKLLPEPPDYSKPMSEEDMNKPYQGDNFLSGKVAMTLIDYGWVNQIILANKNAENTEGYTPIEWDVVTVPYHEEAFEIGGTSYMNGIMGINAKGQNPEDAWKFISFINGEEWAKIKSKSSYTLVSRKSYNKPKDGLDYNMAAFSTLVPAPNPYSNKLYRKYPRLYEVQSIGQQKFQEALKGTKTVNAALKEWENEGNAMLQQFKENPNGGGVNPEPRPIDIVEEEAMTEDEMMAEKVKEA